MQLCMYVYTAKEKEKYRAMSQFCGQGLNHGPHSYEAQDR